MNKIRHNQEVIHESHPVDDIQLIFHPFPKLRGRILIAAHQAFFTELTHIFICRNAARHIKLRQLILTEDNLNITTLCDVPCVLQCLLRIREKLLHLLCGLHIILSAVIAHTVLIRHLLLSLDAQENIMCRRVLRQYIMNIVGCHKRDSGLLIHTQQSLIDGSLFRDAVVLQLKEIIPLAENSLHFECRSLRFLIESAFQ